MRKEECQKLIESMPRRLEAVIKARSYQVLNRMGWDKK